MNRLLNLLDTLEDHDVDYEIINETVQLRIVFKNNNTEYIVINNDEEIHANNVFNLTNEQVYSMVRGINLRGTYQSTSRLDFMLETIQEITKGKSYINKEVKYFHESKNIEVYFKDDLGTQSENFIQYNQEEDKIYLWNGFREQYIYIKDQDLRNITEMLFA